ncbi:MULTISPECIES: HAD family hydrolase [Streptomyces]|uniref:HAD family hydrolase n=1 Tax=Streptomyces TaxID=1883 RepID=UPI00167A69FC|nr:MULTISPECIES: HAD family hydrolase [Streptomyces]WGP08624.1 HAD family hydrolase [Streptomyces sp. SH5]GGP72850.1 haloacid dehalogenase [Streptomyces sindenensis]
MAGAAIFDVDGTLTDTNHLHVVAWWEAFRQAGHTVPMTDIHRAVGLGSGDLIERLLGAGRDPGQDGAISSAHTVLYGTYFDRLPAFRRAGDLLRTLAGRGWRVVLATSASGAELAALRRAVDADEAVRDTASSDDVDRGKPAAEPVELACRLAGVTPGQAVFVGDTVWDMEAATRAGVRAVAVLSGGIPRADLERAGADAVYRDVADLLDHLDDSPFGAGPG